MQSSLTYPTASKRRLRRNSLDFALIFFVVSIITLVLGAAIWQFWHANRIFSGVNVAGFPVGGMTRIEAVNYLTRQLSTYPLPPVNLTHGSQKLPLTDLASSIGPGKIKHTDADLVSAVNRAYLVGRDGSVLNELEDQLFSLFIGMNVQPRLTFDRAQLRHMISTAALKVRQPARPQRIIEGVVVPAQPGINVDVEATLQALLESLRTESGQSEPIYVPFATQEVAPPLNSPTAADAGVNDIVPVLPSLIVSDNQGMSLAIDAATLETILFSTEPLRIDRLKLSALLDEWADQIRLAPRDARLKFNPATGTVSILQTSLPGRELDVQATLDSIEEAVSTGKTRASLVVNLLTPAVDVNRIPEMGIRELVASGTTYFAGSSAARVRNIEVAAAQFEGVVIPPGKLFSFNQLVEDVSSANGFEDSLIIWGDQTAVGVGGGVCQVSTTVFRAAYEAGLPIVERYNHGYVVSWYGEPGLDATIYTPTVDFKFRNDTSAYLLVDPVVDSVNGVITFNLYGTKPDRVVKIAEPAVSDIVEPEPAIYKVDEDLAPGQQEQVEWQKEGKTVEVTRTIIENGESRTDTITSKYQPWQAVYLVGPGTQVPGGAIRED